MSTDDSLGDRKYTIEQVAIAAGVSRDVIVNINSKAKPKLYSPSPLRGMAREYFYIDVLQLALTCRLIRLTQNLHWSAKAIEDLVHGPARMRVMDISDKFSHWDWYEGKWFTRARKDPMSLPGDMSKDIYEAHPIFTAQHPEWYIIAEERFIAADVHYVGVKPALLGTLTTEDEGFFFNGTKALNAAIDRLSDAIQMERILEGN